MQHQVAEIDGVHSRQPLLVLRVERHCSAMGEGGGVGGRDLVGSETSVLPTLDQGQQQPGGPALLVDVLCLQDLLQEADLVVGVEDREARFEPGRLGVPAQDARGDCVEGAEPGTVGGAADHRLQPLAHLARGLVGEGDREQFRREGAAGREGVRKPGGQDARLPGAGAGQHQDRAVNRNRRRAAAPR